jgi:hypothetical protein
VAEKFCGEKKGKRNFGDCKRIFEQAVVEALDATRDISDPSEHLVTRLFLTRPQNSIWRPTRSGSIKNILLFSFFFILRNIFFVINTRDDRKHQVSYFYLEKNFSQSWII